MSIVTVTRDGWKCECGATGGVDFPGEFSTHKCTDRCPCGGIILADTEDLKVPLCVDCAFATYGKMYNIKVACAGCGKWMPGGIYCQKCSDQKTSVTG